MPKTEKTLGFNPELAVSRTKRGLCAFCGKEITLEEGYIDFARLIECPDGEFKLTSPRKDKQGPAEDITFFCHLDCICSSDGSTLVERIADLSIPGTISGCRDCSWWSSTHEEGLKLALTWLKNHTRGGCSQNKRNHAIPCLDPKSLRPKP